MPGDVRHVSDAKPERAVRLSLRWKLAIRHHQMKITARPCAAGGVRRGVKQRQKRKNRSRETRERS
ncbi:MAG: hypothetical protein AB3N11_17655 [Arenibacterium sp.]